MRMQDRVGTIVLMSAFLAMVACGTNVPVAPRTDSAPSPTVSPIPSPATSPVPAIVFTGQFRSLDKYTGSGEAQTIANPDGSRLIRFTNFSVSKGPALRVYLSAAASDSAGEKFDDDFIDVGALQSNSGDQEYRVPSEADISRFRSVVVWCTKFRVGFTVAPIA
jgi:hypothetical protein